MLKYLYLRKKKNFLLLFVSYIQLNKCFVLHKEDTHIFNIQVINYYNAKSSKI